MDSNKNRKIFSLKKLADSLKSVISKNYNSSYWIKAEISKLNFYPHSGHCYPDLVEKKDNKIIAQQRAIIWASNYNKIQSRFKRITGESLGDNMEILFLCKVNFSPVYGLSLIIEDIDTSFTLGKLAKEKTLCLEKLKKQGLFNKNRSLEFPLLPKRIAIISVESSKGYSDFINILENNPRKYKFEMELFPALLQGDKAADSIIRQLIEIQSQADDFDLISIIRGGGGEVGLSAYDNFELNKTIANMPLPVLTGIGHSTNETVAEMISFKNAITPTDVAYFLISKYDLLTDEIESLQQKLHENVKKHLIDEKAILRSLANHLKTANKELITANNYKLNSQQSKLHYASKDFVKEQFNKVKTIKSDLSYASKQLLNKSESEVKSNLNNIKSGLKYIISQKNNEISSIETKVNYSDPVKMLERGYSISTVNGKILNKSKKIKIGDKLTTKYLSGEIESRIEKIKNNG